MDSSTPPRLRIALSVVPPLLADSLRVLLVDERTDVTVIVDGASDRYDVALVTPGTTPVDADVTIVFDDDPQARGGGVLHQGPVATHLGDVHEVVAAIHHFHPGATVADE
ncbi:MAG: hypothetical protein WEB03_00465 [Nitriliruptor sp.]|uniref:hypothetical protein n=1 Tax=Nitriliruptor sp. TaxID=2448056 RepID=UPI0034A09F1D